MSQRSRVTKKPQTTQQRVGRAKQPEGKEHQNLRTHTAHEYPTNILIKSEVEERHRVKNSVEFEAQKVTTLAVEPELPTHTGGSIEVDDTIAADADMSFVAAELRATCTIEEPDMSPRERVERNIRLKLSRQLSKGILDQEQDESGCRMDKKKLHSAPKSA
ncbi:MAG: hypothetical protein Q9201_007055 [Fulgogasparrea decipioides]